MSDGRQPVARIQIADGEARTPLLRRRLALMLRMKAQEIEKGEAVDLTDCALYTAGAGMTILGISGHLRAGKDTVADYLCRAHGFQRVGFADCLKDEVAATIPRTLAAYLTEHGVGPSMAASIRDALWTHRTPVTRALLQEWGTELRRREDPDYWIDKWEHRITMLEATHVVVPDVRFPNEAQRIRDLGGCLIRVERPGHEGDTHQSETGMETWTDYDVVLQNTGTVVDLEHQVEAWWGGRTT